MKQTPVKIHGRDACRAFLLGIGNIKYANELLDKRIISVNVYSGANLFRYPYGSMNNIRYETPHFDYKRFGSMAHVIKPKNKVITQNLITDNMKHKTNEQMLRALLKDLNTIETALLVERIKCIKELTVKSINEDSRNFETAFTTPKMYIDVMDKIDKHLK